MSARRVSQGKSELLDEDSPFEEPATQQIRLPGGGCKRLEDKDPGLLDALEQLVNPAMNGRGRPLTSFQCVVQCIANTKTSTGLSIQAELDETIYEKGIKVSDQDGCHQHQTP